MKLAQHFSLIYTECKYGGAVFNRSNILNDHYAGQ